MTNAEKIVDHFEPLVLGRVVDGGDVGKLGEFGGGVVLQEAKYRDDARWGNANGQFVFPDGELLDVFGKT